MYLETGRKWYINLLMVYKFIDEKVASLKQRKINKRKKHVLKSRVNLNKLHDNFVLVPADKASNNVIVVCKKYYIPRCSD